MSVLDLHQSVCCKNIHKTETLKDTVAQRHVILEYGIPAGNRKQEVGH